MCIYKNYSFRPLWQTDRIRFDCNKLPTSHSLHMKWIQLAWQADESACPLEIIVSFYKLSVVKVARPRGKRTRVRTGGSAGIMRRLTFNDSILHQPLKAWPFSCRQCLTVEALLLSLIAVMSGASGLPVKSLGQFLLTVHSHHWSFLLYTAQFQPFGWRLLTTLITLQIHPFISTTAYPARGVMGHTGAYPSCL